MPDRLSSPIPTPHPDWEVLRTTAPCGTVSVSRESLTLLGRRIKSHLTKCQKLAKAHASALHVPPTPADEDRRTQKFLDDQYARYSAARPYVLRLQGELGAAREAELRLMKSTLAAVSAAGQAIDLLSGEAVKPADLIDHEFVRMAKQALDDAETAGISPDDDAWQDRKTAAMEALTDARADLNAAIGANGRRYEQALAQRAQAVEGIRAVMAGAIEFEIGKIRMSTPAFDSLAQRVADHIEDAVGETRADLLKADGALRDDLLGRLDEGIGKAAAQAREATLADVRSLAETSDKIARKARNAAFNGLRDLERLARTVQEPAALTGAKFLTDPKWADADESLEVEGWKYLAP